MNVVTVIVICLIVAVVAAVVTLFVANKQHEAQGRKKVDSAEETGKRAGFGV